MAFDQSTRNRLARFVGDARSLLSEEFTRQLQNDYGMDPENGTVTEVEKLTALDDSRRETAHILRETLDYYLAGKADDKKNRQETLQRIVREQAFTVLNRLCALRMAESRGILIESIAQGYQSKGFQLYARLAGSGLGETGDAYRAFLFSLFDEFAVDLAALFDRFNPQGRLFPRETILLKALELINDPEIDALWAEDETIGWIYQYFNSKEERKAMRDASQAPRNSRELAVRNQFFTPRYVVEFLTDNTLGRIWYEMTQGETALKDSCQYLVRRPTEIFLKEGAEAPVQESDENLSQEELLRQPVYIPHRPLKDPRELKMLDPACGSMHFGLYSFDLFERIYAEAWELEETLGKDTLWRLADLDALHDTYPSKELFLRDVPRLIIERNIHGVDIDPRAVQIAGLSLWLRAQRSWQAQGVKAQDRPQIRRSNIVCAEPMPGDREMLEEFLGTLKEDRLEALMRQAMHIPDRQKVKATKAMAAALGKLVRTIWQEMELAGEAGSLLKIEETLREAIAEARKESEEKSPLFQTIEFGEGTNDERLGFWDQAETLTLTALQNYAEQAAEGQSYRRRLFAGDAAHGFAFIDLCQKRYDVILMNPPFGEFTTSYRDIAAQQFLSGGHEIITAFIERGSSIKNESGLLGAISSRTVFFAPTTSAWRKNQIIQDGITVWVELGGNVLDSAMVEVCMYVVGGNPNISSIFIRPQKQDNLSSPFAIDILKNPQSVFLIKLSTFQSLSGEPFAYWLDHHVFWCLKNLPNLEQVGIKVRVGLQTGDDFRFIRNWCEIPNAAIAANEWHPHAKGGDNSPYYSDIHLMVNWKNGGNEIKSQPSVRLNMYSGANPDLYLKPGMTFSYRTNRFSPGALPENSITGVAGMGIFAPKQQLTHLLAFLNSSPVNEFISARLGLLEINALYQAGTIQPTPFPIFTVAQSETLSQIGAQLSLFVREFYIVLETSLIFSPQKLRKFETLGAYLELTNKTLDNMVDKILELFDKSDDIILSAYGFSIEVAQTIRSKGKTELRTSLNSLRENSRIIPNDIISFIVGCILSRWDIRFAIGEMQAPPLSDIFAPLPACSPGMLQTGRGLPVTPNDVPDSYPLRLSWGGILTDDEVHLENIETRAREALRIVWDEHAESIEAEACQIMGVRSLREYFQKPSLFFAEHLARYSKSRRQAPIYWQLSTPSNSYSLWLYYHRLNDQTLFTCVNDFVDPKIKQVAEEAKSLRQKKSRSSSEERELERLTDFERELKDFRDELLRVAKFWKPNLNDGVQITAAPLWKLFQHRPWQKKLKETWESLEAGEYDWSHLAYSIWSDRVREKCKSDKSLAIAHDLEHLYIEPKVPLKKKAATKKKSKVKTEELFDEDN